MFVRCESLCPGMRVLGLGEGEGGAHGRASCSLPTTVGVALTGSVFIFSLFYGCPCCWGSHRPWHRDPCCQRLRLASRSRWSHPSCHLLSPPPGQTEVSDAPLPSLCMFMHFCLGMGDKTASLNKKPYEDSGRIWTSCVQHKVHVLSRFSRGVNWRPVFQRKSHC